MAKTDIKYQDDSPKHILSVITTVNAVNKLSLKGKIKNKTTSKYTLLSRDTLKT